MQVLDPLTAQDLVRVITQLHERLARLETAMGELRDAVQYLIALQESDETELN